MLSASDLAGMRATVRTSLPDTCDLIAPVRTPDGAGGWTNTPFLVGVDCRVSPLATAGRDFESLDSGLTKSSVPWVATFPDGTLVEPDDRFLHHGETFEVIASSSERTYEIDVRVICRLIS